MPMLRTALLIAVLLGIVGCVAPSFLMMKQFIDVDETLVLAPKMKKNTVLQYVGTPVEVRAGILLKDSSIIEIWIYNVREKLIKTPIENLNVKPPKNFVATDWDTEKRYALFFLNDGLVKWGYLEDVWPQYEKTGDILINSCSDAGGGSIKDDKSSKHGFLGILRSK